MDYTRNIFGGSGSFTFGERTNQNSANNEKQPKSLFNLTNTTFFTKPSERPPNFDWNTSFSVSQTENIHKSSPSPHRTLRTQRSRRATRRSSSTASSTLSESRQDQVRETIKKISGGMQNLTITSDSEEEHLSSRSTKTRPHEVTKQSTMASVNAMSGDSDDYKSHGSSSDEFRKSDETIPEEMVKDKYFLAHQAQDNAETEESSEDSKQEEDERGQTKEALASESDSSREDDDKADESTSDTSEEEDDEDVNDVAMRTAHLRLLEKRPELDELNEIKSTPLFTEPVRRYAHSLAGNAAKTDMPFSQYGLLGGDISDASAGRDPRLFWNIAAPSSFFICGSQGSGKSHHLACLLENCLAPCEANVLPRALTGIVFHYDTFISDTGGSPCEVAWLSSNRNIKVRVLCPPTNIGTMKKLYSKFPNIKVQELRLRESDLNTKRMLDLMAITSGGSMPLYMSVVNRVLRELRVTQQHTGAGFDYTAFKQRLSEEQLTEMQMAPLKQRLDTLESFMVECQAKAFDLFQTRTNGNGPIKKTKKLSPVAITSGIEWTPANGTLTIVDLSCPCVTAEMACSLFNICLSLFLEQDSAAVGRVIALDEAHKYMNESAECQTLTESLLATIRLQRHLGARVLISTQEPTISPKLLDLCSVTVVHRFTSPDWLNVLKKHLAGVSRGASMMDRARKVGLHDKGIGSREGFASADYGDEEGGENGFGTLAVSGDDPVMELFSKIVGLRVGEALIFAPSAVIGVTKRAGGGGRSVQRLTHGVMKVRIRNRTTADGGRSIMAA